MKRWVSSSRLWKVCVPGATLFCLGGCGLSDAQLTSIATSVITNGLTALLYGILGALVPEAGTVT
jgi:hypothetical protein